MACVLGHRAQELDHCTFPIRYPSIHLHDDFVCSDGISLKGSYLDGGANHPYAIPNHTLFLELVRLVCVL